MMGLEIANCYTEENDPVKIKSFLESESKRNDSCRIKHKTDMDILKYFQSGFPLCTGVALGIDRLLLSLSGTKSISEMILFPFSDIVLSNNSY